MIGLIFDGIVNSAFEVARALLMTREQQRRWLNDDRGDRRPVYAPPITRHYTPWPGGRGDQGGPWPYQPWPGSDGQ